MRKRSVLLDWLVSAVILWLLSLLPFLNIRFNGIVFGILIVAVVLGAISAFLVPIVKGLFKNSRPWVVFVSTLVIDAAALMLTALIVPRFEIGFISALIAGAILAAVNTGVSMRHKD
jgi:uncharacterized membrane protein YvlD (DUF360 family)